MPDKAELESTLNRVHAWIWQVDQKVAIFLPAQAAVIGFLGPALTEWFNQANYWGYKVSILVAIGFQVVAVVLCGRALFPDTTNNNERKSVTFFGHIAGRKLEKYRHDVGAITEEELREDYIEQIHASAKIATNKFKHFKQSLLLSGIGLGLLAVTYWIHKIKG